MDNEAVGCCDILLRNVPRDVVQELARRAEVNFRARMYEAIAILAAVCRSDATLPGLGVGEMVPTLRGTEAANHDGEADAQNGAENGGEV